MTLESTENIPASLFKRLFAIFYDSLLMLALLFIMAFIVTNVFLAIGHYDFGSTQTIESSDPIYPLFQAIMLIALYSTAFLFLGWFWTHGGQTLGMRTWKLKLISKDGSNVSWDQAFIRCFTALISWGAFGLGFLWALFDKENRTWHDLASGTILIQLKKT